MAFSKNSFKPSFNFLRARSMRLKRDSGKSTRAKTASSSQSNVTFARKNTTVTVRSICGCACRGGRAVLVLLRPLIVFFITDFHGRVFRLGCVDARPRLFYF